MNTSYDVVSRNYSILGYKFSSFEHISSFERICLSGMCSEGIVPTRQQKIPARTSSVRLGTAERSQNDEELRSDLALKEWG